MTVTPFSFLLPFCYHFLQKPNFPPCKPLLDWYVGPNRDNNWHQAKAWTENLTVAGGGWRMPTVPELKAIYQKGASLLIWTRYFNPPGFGYGLGS